MLVTHGDSGCGVRRKKKGVHAANPVGVGGEEEAFKRNGVLRGLLITGQGRSWGRFGVVIERNK